MQGREILIGVCGGVAAYKTADLVSKLVQAGAHVSVVMTKSAPQFIGPATFAALTNRPVHQSLFEYPEHPLGEHIGLARRAELVVVAPTTANFLAKLAHGQADDLLSTLLLVSTTPVLLAPAMNADMWEKPAVQRNVKQVQADGYEIIQPGSGWLSCQQIGTGRMAEALDIFRAIETKFADMENLKQA
jgi:phosphopantothenoylcysteine decarboxylase/phosphopantothenate--cysteine ligase